MSAVFPVTYAASVVAFALLLFQERPSLGWIVAALYSFSHLVGAIGLYELVLDEFSLNTMYLLKLLSVASVLFGLISLRVRKLSPTEL